MDDMNEPPQRYELEIHKREMGDDESEYRLDLEQDARRHGVTGRGSRQARCTLGISRGRRHGRPDEHLGHIAWPTDSVFGILTGFVEALPMDECPAARRFGRTFSRTCLRIRCRKWAAFRLRPQDRRSANDSIIGIHRGNDVGPCRQLATLPSMRSRQEVWNGALEGAHERTASRRFELEIR